MNKYGFQESGEYLTPYEHTVKYNPDDLFQTAVAVCAYRSQLCSDSNLCQYISPKIILFDPDENQIKMALTEGFQCVIAITNNMIEESSRVIKVDHNNFHDIVSLNPGMTSLYLIEIALSIQYKDYVSNTVSKQDACDFKLALDKASSIHNYTGWNGIQGCDALIERGRNIRRYRESLALKSLASGTFVKDINDVPIYVVMEREFRYEVITMAKNHLRTASADVIIVYHVDYEKKIYDIIVIPRSNSIDAMVYAPTIGNCVWSGNSRVAYGSIPLGPNPLLWL